MSDHAPGLDAAFPDEWPDGDLPVAGIEGELPPFLRGTYYLNGPGRFARFGTRYRHWLDGDGRVFAARFAPGGVTAVARYVRTMKFAAEAAAGRAVYRTFGTAAGENRLEFGCRTASPANVSVHSVHGRLLAFGEQSLPYELDPETLETRGVYDYDGRLNKLSPVSAHPRTDPHTGEVFQFGVSFAPDDSWLHLYRLDPGGRLTELPRRRLPFPCTIHDFALSERHAVFHLGPYLLCMDRLKQQGRTTLGSLSWEPNRGSRLLVVSRATGEEAATVDVGRGYSLHAVNAFDEGDRVTVDLIEYPEPLYPQYRDPPDLFAGVPPGRPVRYVLDVPAKRCVSRRELSYCPAPDFPVTAPADAARPYNGFWALGISATGQPGRKFFDQLARCDWAGGVDVYRAPAGHYLAGEPAIVPTPAGTAVLCPVFDADRVATTLAVFDAFSLAAGPVARVRLGAAVHLGFHAEFVPSPGVPA